MAYTTIDKPDDYFNTILYTGDGGTSSARTGVGFQPDFVWIKSRSNADNHNLFDSVRGVQKVLRSNLTDAEVTYSNSLLSFDSDGFTTGTHTPINRNTGTHVAWNWLAGGTASSNTDGSITSSVSANTTAGFSIVSWTGNGSTTTVGHGLGTTPTCYITKDRTNGSTNWHYHTTQIDGGMDFGKLNLTDAFSSSSLSAPSSTLITVGGTINTSSANFISYVFAEKKGYSKFGSYTGNGATDRNGTFIYTGFKPAMVILKGTSIAEHWWIYDNKRNPSNLVTRGIFPSLSNAEVNYANADQMNLDFLSNGFKLKSYDGATNGSGHTYIYMAFAENPFVTSTGIPTTAR